MYIPTKQKKDNPIFFNITSYQRNTRLRPLPISPNGLTLCGDKVTPFSLNSLTHQQNKYLIRSLHGDKITSSISSKYPQIPPKCLTFCGDKITPPSFYLPQHQNLTYLYLSCCLSITTYRFSSLQVPYPLRRQDNSIIFYLPQHQNTHEFPPSLPFAETR